MSKYKHESDSAGRRITHDNLRQEDIDQITEFMKNPENLKKLTPLELAQINLYFQQYQEKIAPIVMKAMTRDNGTTFFFRL